MTNHMPFPLPGVSLPSPSPSGFRTQMPKRSSKLRSAMENLGGWAKKRKVSSDADKENKVN
jgi:hypothetical protein